MKHYSTAFARKPKLFMPITKIAFWCCCLFLGTATLTAQTIQLNNPCQCREATVGAQGNATTLDNGQFIETIQVNSGNGEDWYIAAVNGLFDETSPQPPFTPSSFMTGAAGATLTESPAGVYTLSGVHIDALGYTISVTNGMDTLSISNTCAYPNPVITSDIRGGYCPNNAPVSLTADSGTATGTGVFDVLADDLMTVVQANINVFDPASLTLGTYFLRYTFDEDDAAVLPCTNCNPGCAQAIFEEIDIVNVPFSFACNDEITVALGTACEDEVLPDMILEGDEDSYGIFDVNIFQNFTNLGNTATADMIGLNLVAEIVDNCSGNSCETILNVIDNLGPVLDCGDSPIQIVCTDDPDNVPLPTAIDACEGPVAVDLIMNMANDFSCGGTDGVVRRVFRTYTAEDSFGNSGANCMQTIEILKVGLADVVLPLNLDDDEAPALECPATDTSPAVTGFPTINNLPIDGDDFCTISANFNDQFLTGCGGSRKIIRNWTIYDYCEPTVQGVNPIVFGQVIKIKDTTAPTITAPDDITISAFNADCTGNINLPPATVTDACSSTSVSTVSSQGFMASNGGLLSNLPLGIHVVIYTAMDECGNDESDQLLVTVVDDVAPTPICDEFTVASIDQDGEALVPAITLDDGSFDNCTGVSFLIRRLDGVFSFTDNALFDCSDVGQTITVELQILDENGNINTCEIQVTVQNDSQPTIACPAEVTIDCMDDSGIANTGMALANSNCALMPIENTDITTNLNQCGLGFLIREFSVVDAAGNSMNCQQTITIENGNPLLESQVNFPENYAVTSCTSSADLLPENLPSSPINYSEPIINNNSCISVASSYADDIFDVNQAGTVCYKIERTWAIMDWCNDGTVTFSDAQIIEVSDNTAPILTCPANIDIDVSGGTCDTTLLLMPPAIDDCSDNVTLVVVSDLGTGFGPFPDVQAGVYNVTYFAEDGCDNDSNCSMTITIQETEPPVFACDDGMTFTIGADGTVTVLASDFNLGSSDNCTAPEDLLFSFTPNPDSSSIVFDCDDSGVPIFLTVWLTDEAGNQSTCSTDLIINGNVAACDDPQVAVTGMVLTEDDFPINEVTVSVTGTANPMAVTEGDGIFEFNELPYGGDYSIVPEKDINVGNGITGLDLVLISRHILGVQALTSPYKIIAADANNSGTVSTTDVVTLRKIILQITDELPNDNTSWRFVPADHEFSNPNNPFANVFPEVVNFNNLTEPTTADFIGIKVGDVNCSGSPSNLLAADDRTENEPLTLLIENRVVEAGEEVTVDFKIPAGQQPSSLQFGVRFSEQLEFVGINRNALMQSENVGMSELTNHQLRTCWVGETSKEEATVLSITFIATQEISLRKAFSIEESLLKSEATFGEDIYIVRAIDLEFSEKVENNPLNEWTILQNAPNPFQDNTRIEVILATPSLATLTISDVFGKIIHQQQAGFENGSNYFEVNREDLPSVGVYIYEVKTKFGKKSNKMIFTE